MSKLQAVSPVVPGSGRACGFKIIVCGFGVPECRSGHEIARSWHKSANSENAAGKNKSLERLATPPARYLPHPVGRTVDLDVGAKLTGRAGRFNIGALGVTQAGYRGRNGYVEEEELFVGRLRWNPRAGEDLYIVLNHESEAMAAFSGFRARASEVTVKYSRTFRF